jgi:hypothetical protein
VSQQDTVLGAGQFQDGCIGRRSSPRACR